MARRFEFVSASHSLDRFQNEDEYLRDYLESHSLQHSLDGLARTYVLLDDALAGWDPAVPLGYITLRADSLSFYLPGHSSKSFVPVIELECLARHSAFEGGTPDGVHLGGVLLVEACRRVYEAAQIVGIAGMHLWATRMGRKLYDRYQLGAHPYESPDNQLGYFVWMAEIQQIIDVDAELI